MPRLLEMWESFLGIGSGIHWLIIVHESSLGSKVNTSLKAAYWMEGMWKENKNAANTSIGLFSGTPLTLAQIVLSFCSLMKSSTPKATGSQSTSKVPISKFQNLSE